MVTCHTCVSLNYLNDPVQKAIICWSLVQLAGRSGAINLCVCVRYSHCSPLTCIHIVFFFSSITNLSVNRLHVSFAIWSIKSKRQKNAFFFISPFPLLLWDSIILVNKSIKLKVICHLYIIEFIVVVFFFLFTTSSLLSRDNPKMVTHTDTHRHIHKAVIIVVLGGTATVSRKKSSTHQPKNCSILTHSLL